ncbi:MAG TPA: c-type cytochrome biogenesis protein CcsB, partial [Terrimesophilobacter sp.]|nr:c-type cytochrome biogenesis protein CcsB [Terrimesophilobacter sp.]
MTEQLASAALVAIYSAMAVYAIAFVFFAVDLAKRSSAREPVAAAATGQLGAFEGSVAVAERVGTKRAEQMMLDGVMYS